MNKNLCSLMLVSGKCYEKEINQCMRIELWVMPFKIEGHLSRDLNEVRELVM